MILINLALNILWAIWCLTKAIIVLPFILIGAGIAQKKHEQTNVKHPWDD